MEVDERRERIMRVAESLFSDRRLHEVTLDEIVREARVGKGTIYQYFHDKDDLFFQVATRGFDELCHVLACHVSPDDPFDRQLRQACEAISDFFRDRRQWLRMMLTEDARMSVSKGKLHHRWFQQRKHLVRAVEGIIRRGREEGVLRTDLSVEALATFLMSLLRTRSRDLRCQGIEMSIAELVSFYLNGAGGPA